ncbi:unnamed protein product [Paramecium sonneborni]|uniref:Uncharacterized protein n=1 Tax=Paramecium sonneborni TaxID=65129 RepID=A0A8S1N292_9CILI|nr:unnamed protein product [Paramecium sonneborni]
MQDSNSLLKAKRDQLRVQIRRDQLENVFRSKRVIDNKDQSTKYQTIHQELIQNIERQSNKLLQDKNLMKELFESNDKMALVILANSCASESDQTIYTLINDYQIHMYFMQKLQLNNDEDIRYRCYFGLANILYTNSKIARSIKKQLFNQNILAETQKSLQNLKQDQIEHINAVFRLLFGLFDKINDCNCSELIKQSQIIDICIKVIDLMDTRLSLAALVLIKASELCEGLLELFDDEKLKYLLSCTELQDDKQTCQILRLIDELFLRSDVTLIISCLDNLNLDSVIKSALSQEDSYSCQAALDLIYHMAIKNNETIQSFAYLLYDDVIKLLRTTKSKRSIDICLKILSELIQSQILKTEINTLNEFIFEICEERYAYFDYQNCHLALEVLMDLKEHYGIDIPNDYKKKLKQWRGIEHEQLEELISLILDAE